MGRIRAVLGRSGVEGFGGHGKGWAWSIWGWGKCWSLTGRQAGQGLGTEGLVDRVRVRLGRVVWQGKG